MPSRTRQKQKKVLIVYQVVNMPSVETLSGVLRYVCTVAKWDVHVLTFPSLFSAEFLHNSASHGFDGILLHQPIDQVLGDEILQSKLPIVIIGNSDERITKRKSAIAFVDADNERIGQLAAKHFLYLGTFKSFGFVPDIPHTRWSKLRLKGFSNELRQHGFPVSVFSSHNPEKSSAYENDLKDWIDKLDSPSAVLLVGDYKASDFYGACALVGKSIPNDVAVLGVDNNTAICDLLSPALSSVEPSFEKEGYEAARMLDRLMRRDMRVIRQTSFAPVQVVERDSSTYRISDLALVERAKVFIQRHALRPITARDVAMQLGVSTQLLALRFRQHVHKSVRTTIISARLEAVQQLLRTSNLNLSTIAHQCGFKSASYLSHIFKRYFKRPPSQCR